MPTPRDIAREIAMLSTAPSPEASHAAPRGNCPACDGTGAFAAGEVVEACANCDGTGCVQEASHEA